jgi:cyclase
MSDMRRRIIPVLLLGEHGLVKTRKFRNPVYLGDPVNTLRIFNDMEVDEIIILDIYASVKKEPPKFTKLREMASEALFPLAYGGGVSNIEDAQKIIESGFERIVVNTLCSSHPNMVRHMCAELGSSTMVGSMDVKKKWFGTPSVFVRGGIDRVSKQPVNWARRLEDLGVGEIMVNSIDNDGEMNGYNTDLIDEISRSVSVPVIACGGASSFSNFSKAFAAGAAAAAAGAVFVFKGKHRGVLIQYPGQYDRENIG